MFAFKYIFLCLQGDASVDMLNNDIIQYIVLQHFIRLIWHNVT